MNILFKIAAMTLMYLILIGITFLFPNWSIVAESDEFVLVLGLVSIVVGLSTEVKPLNWTIIKVLSNINIVGLIAAIYYMNKYGLNKSIPMYILTQVYLGVSVVLSFIGVFNKEE